MNNDFILVICCIVGIVCVPSIFAAVIRTWGCNTDSAARDAEIDKQLADLQTALRRKDRFDRKTYIKVRQLMARVKQLEKENKRVK